MGRVWLTVLLSTTVLVSLTSGVAFAKPASIKTGTYKGKLAQTDLNPPAPLSVTLKRSTCASTSASAAAAAHLCIAMSSTPTVGCPSPVLVELPLGSFAKPVALPNSGKIIEHAAITPVINGEFLEDISGQSTLSLTFTKKGTASGYFEQNLMETIDKQGASCVSGKVPFTLKLA